MEFQSFRKSFSGDTWTLYIVNQAGRGLTSKQPRILNPKQDTDMKTYRGWCVHLGTNPYPQVSHSLRDGSGLRSRYSFYYLESCSPLPRRTSSAKPQTRNSVKETNFYNF